MFALSSDLQFHLYSQPTDMRKSFDGLCGVVRNNLGQKPECGDVFVFINKSRNKIKLLHWAGSGFILYYKRLEEGTFELPRYNIKDGSYVLSYTQTVMLVDGICITNLQKRKRYSLTDKSASNH